MNVTMGLIVKLASIARHTEEALSESGHPADILAIEGLMADPEVKELMAKLDGDSLLPVKR